MNSIIIGNDSLLRMAISHHLNSLFLINKIFEINRVGGVGKLCKILNGDINLVVIDIGNDLQKGGLDLVYLKSICCGAKVVVMTNDFSKQSPSPCLKYFGDIFLDKSLPIEDIMSSIYFLVTGYKLKSAEPCEVKLTSRQLEITKLVGMGLSNIEISTALKISSRTVKIHLYRAFKALKVSSRIQLLSLSRANGFID